MIDFNRGTTTRLREESFASRLVDAINAALVADNASQPKRAYLGGSRLGEGCSRALQYEYEGAPTEKPFTGLTLRIFEAGHMLEAAAARWIRAAGIELKTEKDDGSQFGFNVAKGRIRGHVDGVAVSGPAAFGPYPFLWENKGLGAKSWNEVVKKGVAVARPVYAAQVAIYQAYMDLADVPALFTAINRDTLEIHAERLPFDAKLAQEASDRGVHILQASDAGERLPRIAASPDHFQCRMCSFANRCWGAGA